MKPDGVFLSNGPGDPAETGKYAVPVIQKVIASGTPTFGICVGHQMLGLAVGAKTMKMHQGHHGANHPVKDETTGKVDITSMNHGFAVDQATLPKGATRPTSRCSTARIAASSLKEAGILGAVSPGSLPGTAGFALYVQAVRGSDAGEQGGVSAASRLIHVRPRHRDAARLRPRRGWKRCVSHPWPILRGERKRAPRG